MKRQHEHREQILKVKYIWKSSEWVYTQHAHSVSKYSHKIYSRNKCSKFNGRKSLCESISKLLVYRSVESGNMSRLISITNESVLCVNMFVWSLRFLVMMRVMADYWRGITNRWRTWSVSFKLSIFISYLSFSFLGIYCWKEQNTQQHGTVWTTDNHLPVVSIVIESLKIMCNNREQVVVVVIQLMRKFTLTT